MWGYENKQSFGRSSTFMGLGYDKTPSHKSSYLGNSFYQSRYGSGTNRDYLLRSERNKINKSSSSSQKQNIFSDRQTKKRVKVINPVQQQILGDSTCLQNGISKRIISKSLIGQRLKQACRQELKMNIQEKNKCKAQRLKNAQQVKIDRAKVSNKQAGMIQAYAANTNQGTVRNYNQDRPQSRKNQKWPKCSFFGLYDGHGGAGCADFLRDNLHQFVIKQPAFPWNPKQALRKGFQAAQTAFLQQCSITKDVSGSCALTILIVGSICYIANVGDSRAILSKKSGKQFTDLSCDHKPVQQFQQKRILGNGGKIFQTQIIAQGMYLKGPLRVFPGKLSVSRTFGDPQAKLSKHGGNPKVVIAEPDITSFQISQACDFVMLGCDGIFDRLDSKDVVQMAWKVDRKHDNIHKALGQATDSIMRQSLSRKSTDNVTVLMIGFENYGRVIGLKHKQGLQLCHSMQKLNLNKTLEGWRSKQQQEHPTRDSKNAIKNFKRSSILR